MNEHYKTVKYKIKCDCLCHKDVEFWWSYEYCLICNAGGNEATKWIYTDEVSKGYFKEWENE